MSNKCYVKNELTETIYVVVSENEDWLIADLCTAVVTAAISGYGALKSVTDVWNAVKWAMAAESAITAGVKTALMEVIDVIREISVEVAPGQSKKVNDKTTENPLSYLSPSAWAAISGASDISLMIVSESGNYKAQFNCNSDASWTCSTNGIVDSEHGRGWVTLERGASDVQLEGQRIGVLKGNSLYVKEGGLSASWVHQDDGVSFFAIAGDRIGVLKGSSVYVKEGGLSASWVHQDDGVSSFALAGDRIGVLKSGSVYVKENKLTSSWVHQFDGVSSFQLEGDRIGVLADGSLHVKENKLTSSWVHQQDGVSSFQLEGDRIGLLTGNSLHVKENKLTSSWVHQQDGVSSFRLEGDRIGVLRSGTLDVKENKLTSSWVHMRDNVASFLLAGDRVCCLVIEEDGGEESDLWLKEGVLTSGWNCGYAEVKQIRLTSTRVAAITASGDAVAFEGEVNEFHAWQ